MTIYLMVKTHSKTGLKYLCKTKNSNYQEYTGSGIDWLSHLKVHGRTFTTEVIKECANDTELTAYGKYYSKLWNVVESPEWANRIPETGGGGTGINKGRKHRQGSCKFCHGMFSIGSALNKHKKSCNSNPDKTVGITIAKKKCCFCKIDISANNHTRHEQTCDNNPNKIAGILSGYKFKLIKCSHCQREIGSPNIKRHEQSCQESKT